MNDVKQKGPPVLPGEVWRGNVVLSYGSRECAVAPEGGRPAAFAWSVENALWRRRYSVTEADIFATWALAERARAAEAEAGYLALDANWQTIHEAATGAIRMALQMPDASVPEMVGAIEALRSLARRATAERERADRAETITAAVDDGAEHKHPPPSPEHWNWCEKCGCTVDDDMLTGEYRDGSEGTCRGCGTVYVATAFEGGHWSFTEYEADEEAEEDEP